MIYSVTDVQGINRISEKVLANAARALAGIVTPPPAQSAVTKPAIEVLDNVYAEPHSGLDEQRAWFGAYLDGFTSTELSTGSSTEGVR